METNKDILNQFNKREKPIIPNGFFDHFYDDLMQKIDQENGVLGQLKKSNKPEIPDGYFDQFDFSMDSAKNSDTELSPILSQLNKSKKPLVEEAFFDTFSSKMMNEVEGNSSKGRIIPIRLFYMVGSIAAALAILFLTVDFNKGNNGVAETTATVAVDSVAEEIIFDDYLAVMDEQELIDYVIESDVTIGDTTESIDYDNYVDYTEEELLDYYLDL